MGKLVELTAAYDSTCVSATRNSPVKVLIDLDAIQTVTDITDVLVDGGVKQGCHVALVPSLPAFGVGSDGADKIVQDQRLLVVLESFQFLRSTLRKERGLILDQED